MTSRGIVIAGGGLAAQRAAETLRRNGYDGPLRMIAAEPELPYDRPPLSKEFLAGELDEHALRFRDHAWYAENAIDLVRGDAAAQPGRRRPRGRPRLGSARAVRPGC